MKVSVWDTYVTRKDGGLMHFDIIVPEALKDEKIILAYGREYLNKRNQGSQPLTTRECRFCHIEQARQEWQDAIQSKGFYIYEMEGCDE